MPGTRLNSSAVRAASVLVLLCLLTPARAAEPKPHWAFQPVRKPALPAVKDAKWPRTPVDAFILAPLERRNWKPAPPSARADWLRRVTFDLIGLPPSPEEMAAFLDDPTPSAEERVVDRLLASPRHGERWAQHWLDVVRYAESEGFEYDRHIPDAWRFRDYVIASLNADKPFDRFITEQLAGDELDPASHELQTASIFHRLGAVRRNAGNPEIALSRNEVLTERTDIVGTAFLGLTLGCARCHDHKLEPFTQKDYYQLQAYLAATDEHNVTLASAEEKKSWDVRTQQHQAAVADLKKKLRPATGEERTRLMAELEELEDRAPEPLPTIPATWNNAAKRTPIHVLKRGEWEKKGEAVGPRPPSPLVAGEVAELPADVPSPRTQLAKWIASPANPLTARVIVNRVWQQHFGTGLVLTANDFGLHGERPSHPELLDWLVATFIENGWHLKPLHRLIVLSSAYRQSGRAPLAATAERVDPENRLLWRFDRRRLSAEEIRDAMLAVSGRLNLKAGGPSVMVPVDAELTKLLYKPSQWVPARNAGEHDRRSVYLMAKRNLRLPFMETFDAPALQASCARRESSTHAPQALELLNGRLSNELAGAFAQRLATECGGDPQRLVTRAYALAVGRTPTDAELRLSLAFLREQPVREFALSIFNLNAFLHAP